MFVNYLDKLKRGPQVILPKDAGMIIAFAGINRESVVLNAGAGSGWLDVQIGRIAKKVVSYEVRQEFLDLAQSNIRRVGLENVQIKLRDVIANGFEEKDADVVVLDFANSHLAIANAIGSLKTGGVIVGYLPHAEQMSAFVQELEKNGFADNFCMEANVRQMLVRAAGVRPASMGITHTAYLVFARKGEKQLDKRERKKARHTKINAF
ncbi:MAG: rRNA adenine N-6-methyltransferase family protein [Candidatus Micrarchaeia archaeon]